MFEIGNPTIKTSALILIESPLQLLNAYEAIEGLGIVSSKIVVRFGSVLENNDQLKRMIPILFPNENIEFIRIESKEHTASTKLKILYHAFRLVLFGIFREKIVVGNLESRFLSLIYERFPREKIIALDDGAKTLVNGGCSKRGAPFNLFTVFDLAPHQGQTIIQHKFSRVKCAFKIDKCRVQDAVFLGMPLIKLGMISREEYVRSIKNIFQVHGQLRPVYVPHRAERLEDILYIQEMLPDISIEPNEYPIELWGIYRLQLPEAFISFYSTALATLKKLYSVQTIAYKILVIGPNVPAVNIVYEHYESIMPVLKVPDA